ncbi:MAG: hypothetical protein WDN66_03090 [Candidatus Saccharibacteria bacterium]
MSIERDDNGSTIRLVADIVADTMADRLKEESMTRDYMIREAAREAVSAYTLMSAIKETFNEDPVGSSVNGRLDQGGNDGSA